MADETHDSSSDASPPAEATAGIRQILSDFDLQHRIGEGGSAVVYRALNRTFNGVVALKVWRTGLTESQRQKFLEECKLQWRLSDHPNIVRLYWADAPADSPAWLATELYETSLAQRIITPPALTRREVMTYADDLLTGLAAVHAEGRLHRDVKPANVLLKGGTAALGDLGITMRLNDVTHDGAAGTDAFVAPELLRGSPPSFRSDVFSAAVTIRSMFGENIPAEIEAVLTRAASHNPDDRPPDAEAMRTRLRQAERNVADRQAAGKRPVRRAPSDEAPVAVTSSIRSRRRARRGMWAALAIIVVLAAGGVFTVVRRAQAPHDPQAGPPPAASATPAPVSASAASAASPNEMAIEQCSATIRKNPRWVCLTQAIMSGNQLVLLYTTNFRPSPSPSGYHLHIFSAQLTDAGLFPPVSTFGMQQPAATQGSWWTDYQATAYTLDLTQPSDSARHTMFNRHDRFVCMRVATQDHGLVRDPNGGWDTGNCVRITVI